MGIALSLALAIVGCSGQGMRTEKTNGTGGVSPSDASGNMGSGSGGRGAGDNAATGGATGSGLFADAGNPGGGGSTSTGGTRGVYDAAAADAAGAGSAGGNIVVGTGGGGSVSDGSRHYDAVGGVDGPGVYDAAATSNDSGAGGVDSGRITDIGGMADMGGDGSGAGEVGRDTLSAAGADSRGPRMSFAVSPQSVDLGNPLVGTSVQLRFDITAAQTLVDLSVRLGGNQLSMDATSTCTANLAEGATCSMVVNFGASKSGLGNDSLIVSAAGDTVVVPVQSRVRTLAELLISPPVAQFSATMGTASSSFTFTIINEGASASGPLVVAVSGVDAWLFSIVNSSCTSPLEASAMCMVTLVFNPRVADGGAVPPTIATATLTATDTGMSASVVSAPLTGKVTSP